MPYALNRRQAALQRLRYGWCHAGLSDNVREMLPFYRFLIIVLWLKSPLPMSHIPIHGHSIKVCKEINDALH